MKNRTTKTLVAILILFSALAASAQELLTTNRTYYVDITNGVAGADGLSSTSAVPTLAEAMLKVLALDVNGRTVTLQLADGTYPQSVNFRSLRGGGMVILAGNPADVGAVRVTGGGATPTIQSITDNARFGVRNIYFDATTTTAPFIVALACHGNMTIFEGINFGATSANGTQLYICCGSILQVNASYGVIAGSGRHLYAIGPCHVWANAAITVTFFGNPNFSISTVGATESGVLELIMFNWAGTATGQRFNATGCGNIYTGGKSTTWIPGNAAGFTGWGGQYF